ncbi:hypothetical protein Godav_016355 [Gossypium davidsonii]|uniref:Transmembrane protein n=2 Tax=Gossypium TaxID=3633 RepID=A0A7J8RR22_GOSDV|nr:hypothetical protein [Gossypium davidsonii]MBA0651571.1 hypothetical protein [Gossypium klotzschianum]
MGLSVENSVTQSHTRTHKIFLISNYLLLGAASSCVFLTLSLRLFPSLCGFFLILLHVITIAAAVLGCSVAISGSNKRYLAYMVSMVLTSIFEGSVSVLIMTRTSDFLGYLRSYVREDDGVLILKLAGGLCVAVFFLQWVVLGLAFVLRYYVLVEGHGVGNGGSLKQGNGKVADEDLKNWPWPFQV